MRVKLKYDNKKPWLSDGLRNAIKQKNKLYIKSIKIRTAQNETRYKTYRNHLKRIFYKAENDYYSNLISANKSNMKKNLAYFKRYYQQENSLQIQSRFKSNDGSVTTDKAIICEKFNIFFIGVGPTLANKIPQQSRTPSSYLGSSSINSMFLATVSIEEITNMIQGLKMLLQVMMALQLRHYDCVYRRSHPHWCTFWICLYHKVFFQMN